MVDTGYILHPNTSFSATSTPSWLMLRVCSAYPTCNSHMRALQMPGPILWSYLNLVALLCVCIASWRKTESEAPVIHGESINASILAYLEESRSC